MNQAGMRGTLILNPQAICVAVGDLPTATREVLRAPAGGLVVEVPGSRRPAHVASPALASLLRRFAAPTTIVAAVTAEARQSGGDPEALLKDSFPALLSLAQGGVLVRADDVLGDAPRPAVDPLVQPGAVVAGATVECCVYRMDDTAVCRGRTRSGIPVALKLAAPDNPAVQALFDREARVLAHLSGAGVPRLHDRARIDGRAVLVMDWVEGIPLGDPRIVWGSGRSRRLAIARRIVAAYAALHERGVLHTDVHPSNILIGDGETIVLVDFALARFLADAALEPADDLGVIEFTDPETAAALFAGEPRPSHTAAAEQFRVGAVVRFVLGGGAAPVDTGGGARPALQAVAEGNLRPLRGDGLSPVPDVEAVLERALSLRPADRYPNLRAFSDALAAAPVAEDVPLPAALATAIPLRVRRLLAACDANGPWVRDGYPSSPWGSVSHGAAGLAAGLLQLAQARDDAHALAAADHWIRRVLPAATARESYVGAAGEIDPGSVDRCSLYHGEPGVHIVDALVAHALCDEDRRERALSAFVAASDGPWIRPDLVTGRAGVLLGAALLYEAAPCVSLARLGEGVVAELWRWLDRAGPAAPDTAGFNLGMAHGLAGLLYATLRWHILRGTPLPETFRERVEQLAAAGVPDGRAIRWPWGAAEPARPRFMPGWCNGDAGQVFLWALLAQHFGERRYVHIAERSAWAAWSGPHGYSYLCCGAAGAAYALLRVFALTGDPDWLYRAQTLALRAVELLAEDDHLPGSLWRGEVGVVVLLADLERPATARLPVFEAQGWTAGRAAAAADGPGPACRR